MYNPGFYPERENCARQAFLPERQESSARSVFSDGLARASPTQLPKPDMLKTAGRILLTLFSIAYPLLWYYGRGQGAFLWLAAAMCGLWLVRAVWQKTRAQRTVSLLLAAFFAAVIVFRRPDSMYWYPVAVSLLMLAVFGASLFAEQTLIERLARLQHPDLPPEGVRHTRRVTRIWCGFFIFNATAAALLALSGRHEWWALYTGIVSYVLMGVLFAGEWIYRKTVLKV